VTAAFLARGEAQERLSRLEHPSMVACTGVDSAGGRPYLVMELVDAVSLDRLLPERGRAKFSLEAGGNVLVAVLDALAAAANDKLVHGRLGSNDILVQSDGTVVVTGFGQSGDGRMDFLAVHRLAQGLGAPWPPEVDAWLDALVAEHSLWKDARGARAAFPLAYAEPGTKARERAVKSRRRKDETVREAARASEEADDGDAADDDDDRKSARKRAPSPALRRSEAEEALKQARVVALSALAIVLVALVFAIFSTG
jgi:serine/threonine protein kinase